MNTVTIYNKTSAEISQIVYELKETGLIVNQHYEFRYFPAYWEKEPPHKREERKTEFIFKEEQYASWFILRWG